MDTVFCVPQRIIDRKLFFLMLVGPAPIPDFPLQHLPIRHPPQDGSMVSRPEAAEALGSGNQFEGISLIAAMMRPV